MPYAYGNISDEPRHLLRQEADPLHAEAVQEVVDHTDVGEHQIDHTADNNPRQKVRQIQHRLRQFLESDLL
ncbi:hypothetical protein D3C75_1212500 [compost metagenome]